MSDKKDEDENAVDTEAEDEGLPLDDEEEPGRWRFRNFAKRLLDRRELAEDTKDLMYAVLATSDKAKTEMVKMVAREVRNYLDELKLKEDLMDLARNHSLEVSISLKPIEHAMERSAEPEPEIEDDGSEDE